MDDLMAQLQEVLSSSEGQENLKQLAGMLGGQDNGLDLSAIGSLLGQNNSTPEPPKEEARQADNATGGLDLSKLDLSALSSLLGQGASNGNSGAGGLNLGALGSLLGQGGAQGGSGGLNLGALSALLGQSGANAGSGSGGLNLGALSSLLGGQNNSGGAAGSGAGGLNLGALGSLLGQNASNGSADSGGLDLGGLNIGALLKMQQVMSSMKSDDKNTALVRAIKPHLKPERQHRADEALRLMQLISMLPALRESGLLGNLFGGGD